MEMYVLIKTEISPSEICGKMSAYEEEDRVW